MFLKTIRKNLGHTQESFARLIGVTTRSISRWETGETEPTDLAMARLASVLNGCATRAIPADIWDAFIKLREKGTNTLGYRTGDGKQFKQIAVNPARPREIVPCVDCGEDACQYDHRDYFEPLMVDAVCQSCNSRRGLAINTFLKHWDYWQSFDWTQAPRTGRWAYKNKD